MIESLVALSLAKPTAAKPDIAPNRLGSQGLTLAGSPFPKVFEDFGDEAALPDGPSASFPQIDELIGLGTQLPGSNRGQVENSVPTQREGPTKFDVAQPVQDKAVIGRRERNSPAITRFEVAPVRNQNVQYVVLPPSKNGAVTNLLSKSRGDGEPSSRREAPGVNEKDRSTPPSRVPAGGVEVVDLTKSALGAGQNEQAPRALTGNLKIRPNETTAIGFKAVPAEAGKELINTSGNQAPFLATSRNSGIDAREAQHFTTGAVAPKEVRRAAMQVDLERSLPTRDAPQPRQETERISKSADTTIRPVKELERNVERQQGQTVQQRTPEAPISRNLGTQGLETDNFSAQKRSRSAEPPPFVANARTILLPSSTSGTAPMSNTIQDDMPKAKGAPEQTESPQLRFRREDAGSSTIPAHSHPDRSGQNSRKNNVAPEIKTPASFALIDQARQEMPFHLMTTARLDGEESNARAVTQHADLSASRQELSRFILPQVTEAIHAKASGTLEIRLNPEELGRVKLVMTPQDAGVIVSFSADRTETLELIRRHVDLLAQDLRQGGYQSVDFQFEGDRRRNEESELPLQYEESVLLDTEGPEHPPTRPIEPTKLDGRLDVRI